MYLRGSGERERPFVRLGTGVAEPRDTLCGVLVVGVEDVEFCHLPMHGWCGGEPEGASCSRFEGRDGGPVISL